MISTAVSTFRRVSHHDAAAYRHAATGEAGAGAAGNERDIVLAAKSDNGGDLGGGLREGGDVGAVLLDDEGVALVDSQVGVGVQHALGAEQPAELGGQVDSTSGSWNRSHGRLAAEIRRGKTLL